MRIIPAIDIINGKCVRLMRGDYSRQTIYNEKPLEAAKRFEAAGLKYLHLVDLDGAKNGKITHYKILEQIATQTRLQVDFGGGLKTDEDLRIAFNSGARQVTGGSIAVKDPALFQSWIKKYGAQKIILGADINNGKITTNAWQEISNQEVNRFIAQYVKKGIEYVVCTDISKDGMLQGASEKLYRSILAKNKVKLIASGGISSMNDLARMKAMGCEGVIVGKAIYEQKINLEELTSFS